MSEREEYAKTIAFTGRSAHDVSGSPEQYWAHLNAESQDTARRQADAIMSAFKRGSGVVVKELSWRIDPDLGAEFGFMPGFDEYSYNITPYTKDGAQVWSAWLDDPDEGDLPDQGPFTSPEAAKAACQADFAQRITSAMEPKNSADNLDSAPSIQNGLGSAVEPSGVATDEVRKLIRDQIHRAHVCGWNEGRAPGDHRTTSSLVACMDIAEGLIVRALSSRTEEEPKMADLLAEITELRERLHTKHSEIRADERERICAWVEDSDPELAEAIRARSLTNGGE